jgi:exosortase A
MTGDVAGSVHAARAPSSQRSGAEAAWGVAIVSLAVIAVAFVALYWRATEAAVTVWYGSATYNHGFLILPMAAYLIWDQRAALVGVAPKPFPWALALMPVIGLVWLVTYLIGLIEGQQFLLVAIMQLILLAVLGQRIYRMLCFPFLYLFFLVPTGEFLIPSLQDFTARFVVTGLRLTGIPVYSDGFRISIPNAEFYVAEACAGLRFLIATIAFGVLFAHFMFRSPYRKSFFVLLCLVTPVIANGLRAYGIILIAYLSNGALAAGVDHIVYGWLFFSLVTLGLTAIGWKMRDSGPTPQSNLQAVAAGPHPSRILVVALSALVLLALPRGYAAYLDYGSVRIERNELSLPAVGAPWLMEPTASDWTPHFQGADQTLLRKFTAPSRQAQYFIAYYAQQNPDKKLVSFENRLNEEKDWEITNRSNAVISIGGESVPVAVTQFGNHGRKRLVLSTYWVSGRFESSDLMEKLLQAKAALTSNHHEAAVIALETEFNDEPRAAMATLTDFAAHLPALAPALKAVAR